MLYWVGKNLKLFCVFSLKVKALNHGIMCDISRASWNSSRTCTKDCGLCYICTEFNIMFLWLKSKDENIKENILCFSTTVYILTHTHTKKKKKKKAALTALPGAKVSHTLFFSVVIFLQNCPISLAGGVKGNVLQVRAILFSVRIYFWKKLLVVCLYHGKLQYLNLKYFSHLEK